MSATAFELSRKEATVMLYTLDDADRLFMHPRGDELLAFWQRINRALCYLDGVGDFHGTPAERSLHVTERDALNIWLAIDPAWLRDLPSNIRNTVRGVVDRCRPSTRATPSISPERPLGAEKHGKTPARLSDGGQP